MEKTHLHGLDTLRALAIILVLLCHYQINLFDSPQWLATGFKFGQVGIDLFFVLSGHLITSQLLREINKTGKIDLKVFYIKRSFKILSWEARKIDKRISG